MAAIPARDTYKGEYLSSVINTDNVGYWVVRVEIDDESKVIQDQPENHSMVVLYELPYAVLEYKEEKFILSLSPSDMLLV